MKTIINTKPFKLGGAILALFTIVVGCDKETNVRDGLREITFKATASKLAITQGETIVYKDSSLNVGSRQWKFEGGSIATSADETVSVTYSEPSVGEDGEVNNGFLTELQVTHTDETVESNEFKVKVYPTVNPEFEASTRATLFGSTIDFTDKTKAGRSAYEDARADDTILWEFEGGNPATSTERNPSVMYPTAGKYKVKMTIYRSVPESTGTTTIEDYIDVLLVPPCDNSVNLLGCNNFNGELEGLSEWIAVGNTGNDKSANLSISTAQFSEGAASIKYVFEEPGAPAFTNNMVRFINAPFTVSEEGSYTLSMDIFAEVLSSGTDYVYEISTPLVGTTNDGPTKEFFRFAGGAWNTPTSTKTLAPGEYYVQIKMWTTPWHADMNFNMFIDNVSIVRD